MHEQTLVYLTYSVHLYNTFNYIISYTFSYKLYFDNDDLVFCMSIIINKWISDLINPYFVGLESLVLDSCVCVDIEYFLFFNSYGISIEENACPFPDNDACNC